MQLTAGQTSLEPLLTGRGPEGRRPFKSQNHRSGRQPIHERSLGAHYPRITDPQAPTVDLNKLPNLRTSTTRAGSSLRAPRSRISALCLSKWGPSIGQPGPGGSPESSACASSTSTTLGLADQ